MSLLVPATRHDIASVRWDDAVRACGPDVVALSVADMDFRAPQAVIDAVVERAATGAYRYTYTTDDVARSVCDWFGARHGWPITPDEVVSVGRVVESMPAILRDLLPTGARVIVPQPAYGPIPAAVRAAGCQVVDWPLQLDGARYEHDLATLETLCVDASAIVLTNPHNPTGRVWRPSELGALTRIAAEAGLYVMSDEVHADILLGDARFTSALQATPDPARTLSFTSPGKSFNLAGLETVNIVVPDTALRSRVRHAVENAGCRNPRFFAGVATAAAYREGAAWLDELRGLVGHHLDVLRDALTAMHPAVRLVEPEGTFLAWIDLRDLHVPDAAIAARLAAAGLVLSGGPSFGPAGSGFVRMNLAAPSALVTEGIRRLVTAWA